MTTENSLLSLISSDPKRCKKLCSDILLNTPLESPEQQTAFKSLITTHTPTFLQTVLKDFSATSPNFTTFVNKPFNLFPTTCADYLLKWVITHPDNFTKTSYPKITAETAIALSKQPIDPRFKTLLHNLLDYATVLPNQQSYTTSQISTVLWNSILDHKDINKFIKHLKPSFSTLSVPSVLNPSTLPHIKEATKLHIFARTLTALMSYSAFENHPSLFKSFINEDPSFPTVFKTILKNLTTTPLHNKITCRRDLTFLILFAEPILFISKNLSKFKNPTLLDNTIADYSLFLSPLRMSTSFFYKLPIDKELKDFYSFNPTQAEKLSETLSENLKKANISSIKPLPAASLLKEFLLTLTNEGYITSPQNLLRKYNDEFYNLDGTALDTMLFAIHFKFTPSPDASKYVNSFIKKDLTKHIPISFFYYLIFKGLFFSKNCFDYISKEYSYHEAAALTLAFDKAKSLKT